MSSYYHTDRMDPDYEPPKYTIDEWADMRAEAAEEREKERKEHE